MELITTCQTPLGPVTMACSQEGLTGLWFEGQKYFGLPLSPEYQTGDSSSFPATGWWGAAAVSPAMPEGSRKKSGFFSWSTLTPVSFLSPGTIPNERSEAHEQNHRNHWPPVWQRRA